MTQGKHVRTRHAGARRGAHAKRAEGRLARAGYPLAFAALFALAIGPGYAIATEAGAGAASSGDSTAVAASAKDETVYAFAKVDGTVKNVKVSDKLSNPDAAAELADSSTLSNIENAEGDEGYRGNGAGMVWAAAGNDIYYKGDSDEALPVTMDVTYRLDGRVVAPDELAGKSGKVEIEYRFENSAKDDAGVTVPFAAVTGLLFDNDSCSGVSVDNGRVVDDGDRVVVIGYALPGLADSLGIGSDDLDIPSGFTVSAQASDFELGSTLTMVTPDLFDSVDLDEFDADELGDASSQLKDAMSKLIEGSGELADGLGELADGAGTLADGTAEMQKKAGALPGGVKKLHDGSSDLSDGLDSASAGATSLASGAADLSDGIGAVSSGASELSSSLEQLAAGAAALADDTSGIPAAIAGIDAIAAQTPSMSQSDIAQLKGAVTAALHSSNPTVEAQVNGLLDYAYGAGTGIKSISGGLDGVADKVKALAAGANAASAGAQKLSSGAADAAAGASQLSSGAGELGEKLPAAAKGASALEKGLGTLGDSSGALVGGIEKIAQGASQLSKGADSAHDGSKSLEEGLVKFNDEGIVKITDLLDGDMVQALGKLDGVKAAGEAYTNFSGITPGTKGSVKFVIETDAIEK